MPSKKNQHDYIPIHEADERVKSKEYAIKGHLSEYPISKWKKNDFCMIDNRRFMHGRTKINLKDKSREIFNIQTLVSNCR